MAAIHVTDANFQNEILSQPNLSLVDCGATWCGPCKKLHPIIDEIADEFQSIKVGRSDIQESPQMAKTYRIMSVPQILFFKNGQLVDTIFGLVPKEKIVQTIEKHKS